MLVTWVYGLEKFFADIQLMLGYKYKMKPWISKVHHDCQVSKCKFRQTSPCVHLIVMEKIDEGRKGDEEESNFCNLFGPTGQCILVSPLRRGALQWV